MRKEEKLKINERIIAERVRVINEDGDMVGVLPLFQAMEMASNKGLDLVEIAPKAKPPTCKIMDYGKWKFKLSKKEKLSRKNQIKIIIKEVQLRPRTDVHDLQIKMRKAKEFLMDGCKVKIHLRYSGREMAHKEIGLKMLDKVKSALLPYSLLESDTPQIERRSAFLFFAPDPLKLKELQKKKKVGQQNTRAGKEDYSSAPASTRQENTAQESTRQESTAQENIEENNNTTKEKPSFVTPSPVRESENFSEFEKKSAHKAL